MLGQCKQGIIQEVAEDLIEGFACQRCAEEAEIRRCACEEAHSRMLQRLGITQMEWQQAEQERLEMEALEEQQDAACEPEHIDILEH